MHPTGFEPTISASVRTQIHALDSADTGNGTLGLHSIHMCPPLLGYCKGEASFSIYSYLNNKYKICCLYFSSYHSLLPTFRKSNKRNRLVVSDKARKEEESKDKKKITKNKEKMDPFLKYSRFGRRHIYL
jgi:hypothetical protein